MGYRAKDFFYLNTMHLLIILKVHYFTPNKYVNEQITGSIKKKLQEYINKSTMANKISTTSQELTHYTTS